MQSQFENEKSELEIFKCSACQRWVDWSEGADDDLFDVCDDCFCRSINNEGGEQ